MKKEDKNGSRKGFNVTIDLAPIEAQVIASVMKEHKMIFPEADIIKAIRNTGDVGIAGAVTTDKGHIHVCLEDTFGGIERWVVCFDKTGKGEETK